MVAEVRLYVPVDRTWERDIDSKWLPAARYLLHTINQRRQAWQADSERFVCLKVEYLRRVIDWAEVPKIRQALIASKAIECRDDYLPNVKSMRYRITPQFMASTFETCDDPTIVQRINRLKTSEERQLLPVHHWLKSNLAKLEFNSDRAISIVSGMQPDHDSPLDETEYRRLLRDQVATFANQLATGDVSLSCDRYGRVHTPLTRLARSLRCCLSISGRPLVSVDLVNSQPLFAGLVASNYVHASKQARRKLRNWKPPKVPYGRQARGRGNQCSTMMQESSEVLDATVSCVDRLWGPPDLCEYIALCESGQFYESLNQNETDRSRFKRQVFIDLFFGEDRYPSKMRVAFAQSFPTVASVIADLKSADYQRLAWLMQHEESKLFIGRICRRLMREGPTVPVVTIHDSLVTNVDHIAQVKGIMLDEFGRLGVRPTFKREVYV